MRFRLAAACGAIVCQLSAADAVPQQANGAGFRVQPEITFQTMAGFGAGVNGSAPIDAIQKPEDRERAYDLLYGESGARLNIVRMTISPDARALADRHYDWASDANTQAVWKAIQPVLRRTKPTLYAVPFTPPVGWKNTGKATHGGSLKHDRYRDYAAYLADFLEYFRKARGVDIDVLSLQNEPGIAAPWQSCVWTGQELRDFLMILAPVVRARGLQTRFMSSEGTAWTGAWDRLTPTLQDAEARGWLSIMASHSYGPPDDQGRRQFAAAAARNGLPVWMSEMSLMFPPQPDDPGMRAAIRTAGYLHRDLVEAHASAWIYCFAIFNAKFQGSMGILSPADWPGPRHGALIVPKRYWAMANFSRFVHPGWKLMQVTSDASRAPSPDRLRAELELGTVNTGFVSPEGDQFAIVAVNASGAPRQAAYDFDNFAPVEVEAYTTAADKDLAEGPRPRVKPHGFGAALPPMSVTTFVGKLAR